MKDSIEMDDYNQPMEDINENDNEQPFDEFLEKQEAAKLKAGYVKIAEGLEVLEQWYDQEIEGDIDTLNNIYSEVSEYGNTSVLEPLGKYIDTDGNFNAVEILRDIDGIDVYDYTDRIGNIYYVCYMSAEKKEAAYMELSQLISDIQTELDNDGNSTAILEKQLEIIRSENELLKKKVTELELAISVKNDLYDKRRHINGRLNEAESQFNLILDFIESPDSDFFCIGPVLCSRDYGVYIIVECAMYSNDVYKKYDLLVALLKESLEFARVVEYNRDNSKATHVPYYAIPHIANTAGWRNEVAVLKSASIKVNKISEAKIRYDEPPKYADANIVRSAYINWLKGNLNQN